MQTIMEGRGSPSAGLYGFLAIVALAGPFLHYFWKDKRAVLAGVLPLLFMLVIGHGSQRDWQHGRRRYLRHATGDAPANAR
jgi:hypothetical protein